MKGRLSLDEVNHPCNGNQKTTSLIMAGYTKDQTRKEISEQDPRPNICLVEFLLWLCPVPCFTSIGISIFVVSKRFLPAECTISRNIMGPLLTIFLLGCCEFSSSSSFSFNSFNYAVQFLDCLLYVRVYQFH